MEIGQEFYFSQIFGSPVGLVMGQETSSIEDATEIEPEVRCKSCECEIYQGCCRCPYCNIKNPLEVVQQAEGIQQAATLEELKETMLELKNGSY